MGLLAIHIVVVCSKIQNTELLNYLHNSTFGVISSSLQLLPAFRLSRNS